MSRRLLWSAPEFGQAEPVVLKLHVDMKFAQAGVEMAVYFPSWALWLTVGQKPNQCAAREGFFDRGGYFRNVGGDLRRIRWLGPRRRLTKGRLPSDEPSEAYAPIGAGRPGSFQLICCGIGKVCLNGLPSAPR